MLDLFFCYPYQLLKLTQLFHFHQNYLPFQTASSWEIGLEQKEYYLNHEGSHSSAGVLNPFPNMFDLLILPSCIKVWISLAPKFQRPGEFLGILF